jgi:hypothetical protein
MWPVVMNVAAGHTFDASSSRLASATARLLSRFLDTTLVQGGTVHREMSMAEQLRKIAEALETMAESNADADSWFTPHEDTRRLLELRGVEREQVNYSCPKALDLRMRMASYCADNRGVGAGNVASAVLDSWLRAQGYPPPKFSGDDA